MEDTEQKSILQTLNLNLWITANAGSGKTTQLVNRFLFLLNNGIKPEEIICITYTEAGAKEMKNRILEIAKNNNLQLLENQLKISTIHGLCLRLLSANNLISDKIQILNNDKYTMDKIIRTISNNIDNNLQKEQNTQVNDFLTNLSKTESLYSLQEQIKKIIEKQLNFFTLFDAINNNEIKNNNILDGTDLNKISQLLPNNLQHLVGKMPEIKAKGINLQKALEMQNVETLYKEIEQILKGIKKDSIEKTLSMFKDKNGNIIPSQIKKIKNWKNVVLNSNGAPRTKVAKSNLEIIKQIQQYFLDAKLQLGVDATYSMLYFAYYVLKEYQNIKQQMQVSTYDDLLFQTFKAVSGQHLFDNNIANNGSNIKHLMLDEAQDTNPISWKIIAEIIKYTKCNFFVVGDEKQSIYRFQGARIEEYEKNKAIFSNLSKQLGAPFDDGIKLNTSYRSIQPILDEADELCNNNQNKQAFTVYENEIIKHHACEQMLTQKPHGYILNKENAIIHDKISEDPDKFQQNNNNDDNTAWLNRTKKLLTKQEQRRIKILDITQKLYKYLSLNKQDLENKIIEDNGIGNSVAIIFPRRTAQNNLVFEIISELQNRYDIDIIMNTENEKKSIYYNDIINLLNFYILQNDNMNLACLLKSDIFNFTDEILTQICLNYNNSSSAFTLWDSLKTNYLQNQNERDKLKFATTTLEQMLKCKTLNEILEMIYITISNKHCYQYFYPFSLIKACANKYKDKFNYDTRSFISTLESEKIQLSESELKQSSNNGTKKQVFFSTIHGVKGMEFDTVILIDLKQKNTSNKEKMLFLDNCFWFKITECKITNYENLSELNQQIEKQEQQDNNEELRLKYVAITRAKRRLIYMTHNDEINKHAK